jgi:putative endonuclease
VASKRNKLGKIVTSRVSSSGRDRRKAERWGRYAETLALLVLTFKGYRLTARRLRNSSGEIDLVMRKGTCLIAVEVKARRELDAALNSVTPRQAQRIARTLAQFAETRPKLRSLDRRIDLICVVPWRMPHHQKNVWLDEGW